MGVLIVWIALSVLAGMWASSKGRNGFFYFFLSIVLSPLVGLLAALIADDNRVVVAQRAVPTADQKRCPFCAEVIKREAIVCRYCSRDLETQY